MSNLQLKLDDGMDSGPLFAPDRKVRLSKCKQYKSGWARRAAELRRATPPWASQLDIDSVWNESDRISKESGVRQAVDHIVPLNHPIVCGLNVPWNLRVIPYIDNQNKSNNWWPDMPEYQTKFNFL